MTALTEDGIWKHCNMCKAPIAFGAEYYVCSVSTCNRKRTGLLFCSLPCFEAHLPTARHRDAWAERETAPTRGEWRFLMQIDSHTDRFRLNWGDAGVGYVFVAEDGTAARFLWQCY